MSIAEAVEQTVDYCIKHDILADFLTKHRAEAIGMSIYEFDEEAFIKGEREIAYNDGIAEGREESIHEKVFHLSEKQAEDYFVKYSEK